MKPMNQVPSQIFNYDVFLSYSARDKSVVRRLAERLKDDGLRVWFDEWEVRPGDMIVKKIEEGLETSRVLVLCMSKNSFASDWTTLESGTFRFRDPTNKERRFIPLRIDNAEIKDSLKQFVYVDWREKTEQEYLRLRNACSTPVAELENELAQEATSDSEGQVVFAHKDGIYAVAVSPDGKWVAEEDVLAGRLDYQAGAAFRHIGWGELSRGITRPVESRVRVQDR